VAKGRAVVEFHVIPHRGRWEIARDDAFTGQFAHEAGAAIHLAIAAAQREAAAAVVCLQAPDGTCRHIWP
jgi:hypothetical protein